MDAVVCFHLRDGSTHDDFACEPVNVRILQCKNLAAAQAHEGVEKNCRVRDLSTFVGAGQLLRGIDQFPYLLGRRWLEILMNSRWQFHAFCRIMAKVAAFDDARAFFSDQHHPQDKRVRKSTGRNAMSYWSIQMPRFEESRPFLWQGMVRGHAAIPSKC